MEVINQEVERNIDGQKANRAARERGLAARENEFERLVKVYGSPEAAEAELRDRQRSLIQSYAIKQALDAGALDAADNLRTQFADWDKERAQDRLKRQAALAGSVEESWVNVPDRYVGGAPKVNENDVQALAKAREAAGLGASEGDKGELADLMSELPEGELPTAESRNVASRAVRSALDFIAGQGTGSEALDTPAERAATSKFERVINAYKSKYLGAARSPAELEDFARGFANVRTKEGLRQYVQSLDRQIARRDAGVKGGFRPEVVETYEERKQSREPRARPASLRSE